MVGTQIPGLDVSTPGNSTGLESAGADPARDDGI